MLPQLKMLSWDMAYDENGNIVIIEVNTTAQSVWFPQMVTGKSIFGEYTAEMLRLAR
jgi:D-alanine-D-alanine ligase-like ATP-grasp enzyme